MEVLLVMFRDGGEHRPFRLSREATIIGRREDCDLRIAVGDVSRKHCRVILTDDESVRVEDLGSSNGTFVNGTRVQSEALAAGDTLQVGPVAFVVQIDGEPSLAEVERSTRAGDHRAVDHRAGDQRAGGSRGGSAAAASPTRTGDDDDDIGDLDELEILNDDSNTDDGDLLDVDSAEK